MPSSVAIIGSGIAGTTLAHLLTQRGHQVTMFEAGPAYPYPHSKQFSDEVLHKYRDPAYLIADDLRDLELSGDSISKRLKHEQIMTVGGMATRWTAWTPRYMPHNFKTLSMLGRGADWPISYDDLEPYYCKADTHLGISGTDDDNPFAPRRSKPYPLPSFPMSYDDDILAARLKAHGIAMHTVPQARTSRAYDGRSACANFRACGVCPIGARYSPNHHLAIAQQTGRLTLHTDAAVRAISSDRTGRATGVVYHPRNERQATEHAADVVIVAAGAIESARLMLLSAREKAAFNPGEHVGRHLLMDHIYGTTLEYEERLYTGRAGPRSAQSYQFMKPDKAHGNRGFKIDLASAQYNITGQDLAGRGSGGDWDEGPSPAGVRWKSEDEVLMRVERAAHLRTVAISCETLAEDKKYVTLSAKPDRFGAPFAAVHHDLTAFDHENAELTEKIFQQLIDATRAIPYHSRIGAGPASGHHHLGTCRMGTSAADSVTDSRGQVHGFSNLFVAGGSLFPANSPANPTLTIVALAIRTAELIAERFA